MTYALGLICGLLVGFGIVALLFRKKVLDMTFDERQERARGKAYQYGFYALSVCLVVYGIIDTTVGRWCDTLTGNIICYCIGLTVFAVTCIRNDAYLSLKEQPRRVMTCLALVAAVNLVIGIMNAVSGSAFDGGMLTAGSVNLVVGVAVLVILAVYVVNYFAAQREDGE